jgi:predicted HTH transcriptional regulator
VPPSRTSTPSGDDIGVENGDDIGVETNTTKITSAISAEPNATQSRLAEITGLSTRTVSREIKSLRESGILHRIGSDRKGYWERVKGGRDGDDA